MPAVLNRFKSALAEGRPLIGCWAGFADAYATEILGTAGFDWLVLDGEHAPNTIHTLSAQIGILHNTSTAPIVRVPIAEDWIIKQVLDAGAQTLLAPMIDTAEQAARVVRAMRYPPEGVRGSGAALGRASGFGAVPDYIATANDQMCLVVQIESRAALDNLEAICAVPGVDAAFIGPSDLANDMGHRGNANHPEIHAAMQDALARIRAAGKAPGILGLDPETTQTYRDWGAQMLGVGIDVLLFANAARTLAASWKP
ncbi:4-hydroxy-2-oxo-heptane-1,7-dioate aldolase [Roseovarius sp. THAF8]|uniref:HpcH/HpaI aldolase family protein n=1 Tax=Roseovarius sp. THAF8 TaxID=2587846 RepID=UPI001268101D|nr:HpcH/HpaI aldolase/citrate lyase family protein [Roseovarius sp. THAF8]QFT98271.1 4-hydroxy-2-oxo-heptane-1,7-dioate aldolase [Roseovarius sp. THAF8]